MQATQGHPAVFAYSVVNEIPADIVRWSGAAAVQDFIDQLVSEAKGVDPECLCTFTSFPPTEFLQAESIDFVCFNVYLHQPKSFAGYLARLQTLAAARPLVLGELGMDSIRDGEPQKCEFLTWQIELACGAGLAGTVVFSFTDDWFRGGLQIEDWGFGLTRRDRQPKESFYAVQRQYRAAPYFPLPRTPKASVVVATYNGGRTLQNCLESLQRLNYPDYEVILVDDGSTDRTPEIAKAFPSVRYIRQTNQGLSAARNAGIRAAQGEIVAFTDDDCRADEDWLYYVIGDLVRGDFVGMGGHNFLPPEDSCVAAAVVVSPGGPAHVMLTDQEAEHIPGCNMAFFKWALEDVGMFNPIYRKAGDDVDICWRLQQRNLKIGFSPAGFVWHYRRSTVKAYLKQQAGYGEAEALLMGEHPDHFSSFGGGIWRGRIYASSFSGLLLRGAVIYHGIFGSGENLALHLFGPLLQFRQHRTGGGFVPAAGRHFADDPRAVAVLRRVRAGWNDNAVPGSGERCRSRLALGVLPLGKPLALADNEPCPDKNRLGKGFLVDGALRSSSYRLDFRLLPKTPPPPHFPVGGLDIPRKTRRVHQRRSLETRAQFAP